MHLELMNKVLDAYTNQHIEDYFNRVKVEGLTEHGFPRLTSNIGILIANGMRKELLPIFIEMMDFCCESIPNVLAGNNFSVREIMCAINELEHTGIIENEKLEYWKKQMSSIDPWKCYFPIADSYDHQINTNWALFAAASELFKKKMGLTVSDEFIDVQIFSQLKYFDENGMYKDNPNHKRHQPIVYDLVSRGLLCLIIYGGYRGKYYNEIDSILKKAGVLTLNMQSVNGELAFGGRSNQFLHNEAWLAAIFEFEASRYNNEGNSALAGVFKRAANDAIENIRLWLKYEPIYHIKNRFPISTKQGCEDYAYFDKYMITCASFLYVAKLFCDTTIKPSKKTKRKPFIWQTADAFHKLFACAGNYYLEVDFSGDPDYDSSGLGRIHKKDAPSFLCLSMPCAKAPQYHNEKKEDASLCTGIMDGDTPVFATDESIEYTVAKTKKGFNSVSFALKCDFGKKQTLSNYKVNKNGVFIVNQADGDVLYMLPAFYFDGESYSDITLNGNRLMVRFGDWECIYTSSAPITDSSRIASNRNGHYKIFYAKGTDCIKIKIEIRKIR